MVFGKTLATIQRALDRTVASFLVRFMKRIAAYCSWIDPTCLRAAWMFVAAVWNSE